MEYDPKKEVGWITNFDPMGDDYSGTAHFQRNDDGEWEFIQSWEGSWYGIKHLLRMLHGRPELAESMMKFPSDPVWIEQLLKEVESKMKRDSPPPDNEGIPF